MSDPDGVSEPAGATRAAEAGRAADAGRPHAADPERIADGLLAWFDDRERDVPWRGDRDPYRIWVAEVMAQQTRIETVRAYYGPFLRRFPTVEALAEAELDEVLCVWEGLGYYGRARNLQRAARELVERGETLPDDPADLRCLPGIGRYTAGAIASLAFGHPEPAVDGNARRVLCRLFDLESPTPARLDAAARSLLAVRPRSAAALNQALMDLGGAVCTPRRPACERCPVRPHCQAVARGTVAARPPRAERRPTPHYDVAVGIVWKDGKTLIQRRPEEGLLGGLWEFPGGKVEPDETPAEAVGREVREELGIRVRVEEALDPVDHAYSHFRVTLHPFHARWIEGDPEPRGATPWAWAEPDSLGRYAFPAANRKIIRALRSS